MNNNDKAVIAGLIDLGFIQCADYRYTNGFSRGSIRFWINYRSKNEHYRLSKFGAWYSIFCNDAPPSVILAAVKAALGVEAEEAPHE